MVIGKLSSSKGRAKLAAGTVSPATAPSFINSLCFVFKFTLKCGRATYWHRNSSSCWTHCVLLKSQFELMMMSCSLVGNVVPWHRLHHICCAIYERPFFVQRPFITTTQAGKLTKKQHLSSDCIKPFLLHVPAHTMSYPWELTCRWRRNCVTVCCTRNYIYYSIHLCDETHVPSIDLLLLLGNGEVLSICYQSIVTSCVHVILPKFHPYDTYMYFFFSDGYYIST